MDSFSSSSQSAFPVIPQVVEKYSDKGKYSVTAQFFGYRAKEDITALPPGFLVSPSQNVLTNSAGLIYSRPGYSLYGPATSNPNSQDGIRSSYDWETHLGFEHHLREHSGVLEWNYVDSQGNVSWLPLIDTNLVQTWVQGSNFFRYAEYWNTTEQVDELMMVNGDGYVYRWNGAKANFATATSSALSASPFLSSLPPGEVITFVCPVGTTFTGSTTTAGNSVLSTTVNGQVVGMILIVNQPAANDTITLVINGNTIVLTWVSSPYQAPWKAGLGAGSIAIGYNYTNIGSTAVQIWAPNTGSPNLTTTRNNLAAFFGAPSVFNDYRYVGFNTSIAANINAVTYNQNPFIQGSTTTAGNTISSTSTLSNLTFAMVNNPANGDTATFTINGQAVQVQFVLVIGVAPGNVLIGGTPATTLSHLLGLLQNPSVTSANQVAFSATNQAIISTFTYASSTGITLQGQQSWTQLGFYNQTTGRSVVIDDTSFTYSGGEGTQTITGVSPDPTTAITIKYGDPIVQLPVATPVSQITGMSSSFNPNLIASLNNHIYYGNTTSRTIFFSKVNAYADCSASSPRIPGDGSGSSGINLDATCTGFAPQDTQMNVFSGPDWIYNIYFGPGTQVNPSTQTSDVISGVTILYESISTNPLKISPGQGALTQEAIFKVKNSVMFVTNEPAIDDLGRVESSLALPEAITITDSIKNDFLNYNLTGAWGLYFKYFLYVILPAESKILIYNFTRGWWESPQTFNFSRLAIINGALYAHSNFVPETYRLFIDNTLDPNVVYTDNGNPINAIAYFSYQNFGLRAQRKHFTEFYVEGYITSNTILSAGNKYDFGGYSGLQTYSILGNNQTFLVYTFADNSIGKVPIGKNPIGSITDSVQNMPKFRHIFTSININFFEEQAFFQSNDVNQSWSLLGFGYDVTTSEDQLSDIKT
jgi:hypothetical protein